MSVNDTIVLQSALTMVGALTMVDAIKEISMLYRPEYNRELFAIKILIAIMTFLLILIIIVYHRKLKNCKVDSAGDSVGTANSAGTIHSGKYGVVAH